LPSKPPARSGRQYHEPGHWRRLYSTAKPVWNANGAEWWSDARSNASRTRDAKKVGHCRFSCADIRMLICLQLNLIRRLHYGAVDGLKLRFLYPLGALLFTDDGDWDEMGWRDLGWIRGNRKDKQPTYRRWTCL